MASGPITSWQIDGETMERVIDFILGGSKVTADGDCSHEIKRHLLLGRKVMTNLDDILKSRDITLPTKVCLVKAMVFPVVMYGYESWTEESWALKNWCFWTVVLEKTLMLGGIGGRKRRGRQMLRWLDGITDSMDVESEWTPGVGDGQGGLACCDSWGSKESDTTEHWNWTELSHNISKHLLQILFSPLRMLKGNEIVLVLVIQDSTFIFSQC